MWSGRGTRYGLYADMSRGMESISAGKGLNSGSGTGMQGGDGNGLVLRRVCNSAINGEYTAGKKNENEHVRPYTIGHLHDGATWGLWEEARLRMPGWLVRGWVAVAKHCKMRDRCGDGVGARARARAGRRVGRRRRDERNDGYWGASRGHRGRRTDAKAFEARGVDSVEAFQAFEARGVEAIQAFKARGVEAFKALQASAAVQDKTAVTATEVKGLVPADADADVGRTSCCRLMSRQHASGDRMSLAGTLPTLERWAMEMDGDLAGTRVSPLEDGTVRSCRLEAPRQDVRNGRRRMAVPRADVFDDSVAPKTQSLLCEGDGGVDGRRAAVHPVDDKTSARHTAALVVLACRIYGIRRRRCDEGWCVGGGGR